MNELAKATNSKALGLIYLTLLLSIGYAVVRYHLFGPVPWKDFSFFILNKGFSLSSLILLSITFSLGPLKNLGVKVSEAWMDGRKLMGIVGYVLVLVHAVMSFMLFNPAVYDKFFGPDNTMTAYAGISMLGGVLSFVILWTYNLSFKTYLKEDQVFIQFITSRRFLLFSMPLIGIHLFFMGFEGWLTPEKWHGSLPPISLVAFVFFAVAYILNLAGRR